MFSKASFGILSGSFCILVFIVSCCSTNQTQADKSKSRKEQKKEFSFAISAPARQDIVRLGDNFTLQIKSLKNIFPDSVTVSDNGNKFNLQKINDLSYSCNSSTIKVGLRNMNVTIFYSDSLTESLPVTILVLPKEAPKTLSYKILRTFKHDVEAYTQGLIYHKGFIYESTGQANRSSIRCVDPKTGEVIRKRKLDPQYFGEGIALIGNEIFMLTYREHRGFVFSLSDFELLREFNLQTDEGWGLTSDGESLILSDGSAYLYYYSPEYFTLIDQKEICNNERLVNQLNELELTPQGLFANIYGQDIIVLIDLEQGIVTHTLDLSKLFPENVTRDMDHVLNGIAYNSESKSFYVTGKQWPVMYEIKILLN